MTHASAHSFLEEVAARNPHQPEFIQAVTEVIESLRFLQDEGFITACEDGIHYKNNK